MNREGWLLSHIISKESYLTCRHGLVLGEGLHAVLGAQGTPRGPAGQAEHSSEKVENK